MPLILPGNVASAVPTTYDVANSCRFNRPDSALMDKTLPTPTSRQKFTFSFWCKRGLLSTNMYTAGWGNSSSNYGYLNAFNADNKFDGYMDDGAMNLMTTRLFRDCSAWYHIVLACDTTQGTAANRLKLYVNGVQETSFTEANYPDEDYEVLGLQADEIMCVGDYTGGNNHYDGYIAEFCYIDGTQYAASDFGEFDSDSPNIWKPVDPSGLTFGNSGFYLDFEASGNLGNDANGGTDLSETNVAAVDQCTDSPTNNFCVMNPLATSLLSSSTYTEGNLKIAWNSDEGTQELGTFGLTSGKWYWEWKLTDMADDYVRLGVTDAPPIVDPDYLGARTNDTYSNGAYGVYSANGSWYNNGSATSYGTAWTNSNEGEVMSIALDLDNNKIYVALDGSWMGSGDPAAGSNGFSITAPASLSAGQYFPAFSTSSAHAYINEVNFGNPSFTGTDQADDNGYGSFEHDVPAGFYAICSKNLGEFGG